MRNAEWIEAYVDPIDGLGGLSLTDEEYLVYGETQDSVRSGSSISCPHWKSAT